MLHKSARYWAISQYVSVIQQTVNLPTAEKTISIKDTEKGNLDNSIVL
jgi:hypothetical protein